MKIYTYSVINIVQSTAWRLKGKNIRVNAICPVSLDMFVVVLNFSSTKSILLHKFSCNFLCRGSSKQR